MACLRQVKDGMDAAFRLYPVDRSKGAPYLARFWRDVGYRNCLLTNAQAKPMSHGDFVHWLATGLADPRWDETGRCHPLCPGAPRTSVRGSTKTGRSPIKALSVFFYVNTKARVPHISLVFCEMWDTTALPPKPFPAHSAYPTLRQQREGWGTRALVVTEGPAVSPHPASNRSNLSHPSPTCRHGNS